MSTIMFQMISINQSINQTFSPPGTPSGSSAAGGGGTEGRLVLLPSLHLPHYRPRLHPPPIRLLPPRPLRYGQATQRPPLLATRVQQFHS